MIRVERLRFGYTRGDDALRLVEFVLKRDSNTLARTGVGLRAVFSVLPAGLHDPTWVGVASPYPNDCVQLS